MHPIILELGPIMIQSMWLMAAIGIIVGGIAFIKLAKLNRLKLNFILDHSVTLIIAGIVGARLIFIVKNYGYYLYQLDFSNILSLLYIWDKGLSFWGGIAGITGTLIYFCKKEKQPIHRWLDILFISAMVGMIFGNIGTFLEGSISYGKETALPWGVKIEGPLIKYTIPIHPTQIYAAFYTLVLAITGFTVSKKHLLQKDGDIFVFGSLAYAVLRFLEEFLRGDDVIMILGLREGQIISLIAILAICIHLLIRYNKLKLPKLKRK